MDEPRIAVKGLSHVGRVRENQEDAWTLWEPGTGPELRRLGRLLVVADGIGGNRAGEVASNLAADVVRETYVQETGEPRARLRSAIREANHRILEETEERPECRGMGTTVVAAVIQGDRLTVAWVGDSRAYLIRGKELLQITRDHSAGRPGMKGAGLSRSLGGAMAVDPDIRQVNLQPGDRILLCSDGLYNPVPEDEILRLARGSVDRWASDLIETALKRGAPDNVTVIVAHIDRLPFAPHRHSELAPGERLDDLQLVEQLGADRFYLWYRAAWRQQQRLLCILRPELQTDNELLLDIEEDEESLGRLQSPRLAVVERADQEKSLAYVCLRLPWQTDEESANDAAVEMHSLDEVLRMLAGLGDIEVERALNICLQVAGALAVVRDSLLSAGAPYASDFWGDGERYALCQWPNRRRQYCVRTSKGVQPDAYLLPYMPPDYTPEDEPGPASDAYFVGFLLQRLFSRRSEEGTLPPVVQELIDSLLADTARRRPDAVEAIRGALQAIRSSP